MGDLTHTALSEAAGLGCRAKNLPGFPFVCDFHFTMAHRKAVGFVSCLVFKRLESGLEGSWRLKKPFRALQMVGAAPLCLPSL